MKSTKDDAPQSGTVADLKAMAKKWFPASAPQVAVPVDISVLKAMVGDDPMVIQEFLLDFQISAAKTAVELRAACTAGQATAAGAAAHKLKSSALTVGALRLGELCAEMERTDQMDALKVLLPRFEAEIAVVDEYLGSL